MYLEGDISGMDGVGRRLSLRVSEETRAWLDALCARHGCLHSNGKPRIAEVVRVLIASSSLENEPLSARVAVAVYTNGLTGLSGEFAKALVSLREELGQMAQRACGSTVFFDIRPDTNSRTGESPDYLKLLIILDEWTHKVLSRAVRDENVHRATENRKPLTACGFVRDLLDATRADPMQHELVLSEYCAVTGRMRAELWSVVYAERQKLVKALRVVA